MPPVVFLPPPHTVQDVAPSFEYLLSYPHFAHSPAPADEDVPAAHCVDAEDPEHHDPAAHGEHVVCVLASPPAVKEPAAHTSHALLPPLEYRLSALQLSHPLEPAY